MNIVVTIVSGDDVRILNEFLASLRHVAKFKGEILIINYGHQVEIKKLCAEYAAKSRHISVHDLPYTIDGFKRLYHVLAKGKPENTYAFFSSHTWFQNSIDSVFDINPTGLLFAPEYNGKKHKYHGNGDSVDESRFNKEQKEKETTYGGEVSSDMIVGKSAIFAERMKLFISHISNKLKYPIITGAECYILNEIFDKEKDKLTEGHIFSVPAYDAIPTSKAIYTDQHGPKREAIGVRLDTASKNFANFRFSYRYPHLFS